MNQLAGFRRVCTCFFLFVLVWQLAALPAFAREGTATRNALADHIESYLTDLKRDENSRGLYAGIAVYDLTDKTYLYRHNAERTYIPASNMKLFTTIAGLDQLGPDYQWKTELFLQGKVRADGVLEGDLVWKGYGDPTLTPADMQHLASVLKQAGIKRISGNLLLDESDFDDTRLGVGWMWDDEPYGYSAQLSALSVHKNAVTLTVAPGKAVHAAPTVAMEPMTTYVTIHNRLQTVEGGETAISLERPRGTNEIVLTGTIGLAAKPYEENVSLEDPALFVGDVWKQQLLAQGIELRPGVEVKKTVLQSGVPFYTHLSRPLGEVIVELNKESDNFYAEMLLKTLGARQKGAGTFEAGSEVVADVVKRAGIATGYRQVDGSGLSRLNLVSAEQIVQLLAFAQQESYSVELEKSLPVAGSDGTLKSRMLGTAAEKNLIAKTGSMSGVNSLSGYVTAQNGHKLAFSILINGIYQSKYARDLQDYVGTLLASYPQLAAVQEYQQEAKKTYALSVLLDPLFEQPQAVGVTAGVLVKSLDKTGDEAILYEKEADALLTPASNLKLLTTAAALSQLGEDYTFKTELYGDAPVAKNGVQRGNLYVKGYGDPSLHTENALKVQEGVSIEKIAAWINEQGVKEIQGNLVLDESYFDTQRLGLGWAWDDESFSYNPTLGALAVNRGTVMIAYEPAAKAGEPVSFNLLPKTSYVAIINEAKTVAPDEENTFAIVRDRGTNTIRLTGHLPLDHPGDYERVPVEDPAKYVGTLLKEALESEGVRFAPGSELLVSPVPPTAVKWNEFASQPLPEIVSYLNKKSDNFYAEMLLKTLGAVKKGEGSAAAGAKVVQEAVAAMGGQTNFDMVDGSGLTRYNLISVRHIVTVLEGMAKQPAFSAYEASLPVAGVDGTLKNRLAETAAAHSLHAKTGSMTGINSLSGYLTTKSGERLVISVIFNGFVEDEDFFLELQDRIVSIVAAYE
ncbi:D-alanyl-D-alanine carboxypeptidase/D-alanyl-D-alanine endopeptidase [Brevibacillus sp. SAFN-007a]|uniref:D-alanyl-D-alanine carboxypeptidase/D-alanyl-D-alanine endopeptidase n=1 Tax=Brevibacillus sp. SAFN-007a TaxID=3436862 RepID=UPI003F81B027